MKLLIVISLLVLFASSIVGVLGFGVALSLIAIYFLLAFIFSFK